MIVRRALLIPLILLAAVIGQLAVVNRAPLPGHGGVPDLVLLVVTALGVVAGPMTGLLAGFAGGLAIDIAPPGGHLAGEYALVYCLAGYACGRIRDAVQGGNQERSATTSLTVMAVGVAAGEVGKAALGLMLSDPNVTGPAIRHVLPAAVVYDLLLCPLVLWVVSAAVGRPAAERAPRSAFLDVPRLAFLDVPRWAPAFRPASTGAAPPLRLAGSSTPTVPRSVRAEPKLRLARGGSSLSSRTGGPYSSSQSALGGGRPVRVNFTGSGSALNTSRAAAFQAKSPGKGWLNTDKQAGPAWQPATPGKGWARTGKPAGITARQARSPGKGWLRVGRPGPPVGMTNWQGRSPGRGWLRTVKFAGPAAWRTQSPGSGWLRLDKPPGSNFKLAAPGKGWLRPAKPVPAARRKSPGKGWLRPAKPVPAARRKSPGRGWLRTSKPPRQNWYTRSPSTRWLRRGRRKRLLGGRR
jgi:rod shape-determining protein MreD